MTEARSQIGDNLKRERLRVGLTQGEAAKLLGVDLQTVSRWERGERRIKAEDYERAMGIYAEMDGKSVGQNVSRGTPRVRETLGSQARSQRAVSRMERAEKFEREMIRLGADDYEADRVRIRARAFIESVLSSGGIPDLTEEELDRELEVYLEYNLKPWVIEHMQQRGATPNVPQLETKSKR